MKNKCLLSGSCPAPLCPEDLESLSTGIWYPEEEICRTKSFLFIYTQKKIRKAGVTNEAGIFNHKMLNRRIRVSRKLKGLNPDKDEKEEQEKWLKAHRPLKVMGEEERKMRRAQMEILRQKKNTEKIKEIDDQGSKRSDSRQADQGIGISSSQNGQGEEKPDEFMDNQEKSE